MMATPRFVKKLDSNLGNNVFPELEQIIRIPWPEKLDMPQIGQCVVVLRAKHILCSGPRAVQLRKIGHFSLRNLVLSLKVLNFYQTVLVTTPVIVE